MSMLSEQTKHLRELSDTARVNAYSFEALSQSLKEAADTIEILSAKLEANDGEWINDEKPKERGHYFITTDTVLMGEVDSDVGYWDGECWNTFSNVYAWKPIDFPEPYRP